MFQSSKKRMQALLDIVDDMLVGAPEEDLVAPRPHPHRRPVELRVVRRAGSVAARPMHCLSPVRTVAERDRTRDEPVR
jgi:hypothetical protein